MIRNTELASRSFFYATGNTPPACLTQSLPPDQNADILLLGCGDVRNVLFTCYADAGRKIDVTCCDIEAGIHARNVLLYSLLIEDQENLNIEHVWNIYYHWKLAEDSLKLLEMQSQKLLDLSSSIDQWHDSIYGSSIRFCDERSLSLVRTYWTAYRLQDLSDAEKTLRQKQMQTALNKAKAMREKLVTKENITYPDIRSTTPFLTSDVLVDLSKVSKHWWDCGTIVTNEKATELNPAFLFAHNARVTLHSCSSPLCSYPLCSAFVPIAKGSSFYPKDRRPSSTEHLEESARTHFRQWASAFRRAVKNKSVIRVFCGDALAFGLTLRHCLVSPEREMSMNLFCSSFTSSPLKLHPADYSGGENAAPLRFDVIDTSNLIDILGALNIIGIGSSLLKYNDFSSLYVEQVAQKESNFKDRLSGFFGVDARCSMLFGLVLPDSFTNATDNFENDVMLDRKEKLSSTEPLKNPLRMRLCWKRLRGCQESTAVQVEAKELAKLLIKLHDVMFKYEDLIPKLMSLAGTNAYEAIIDIAVSKQVGLSEQSVPPYNRLSFALVLNLLRSTVITDWDQCIQNVCDSFFGLNSKSSIKANYQQDLKLQMHLCGVHNFESLKPTLADVSNAILAPILPLREKEDVPEQLCVTIRVSREELKVFSERKNEKVVTPSLTCTFEGKDPGGESWLQIFSAVQVTFGVWKKKTEEGTHPYIEEDITQLSGTSDMFVSVYVPTRMLLQSKMFVPSVKCGLIRTAENYVDFMSYLDQNLYFACNEMTDKDVFLTRYMPGLSSTPIFVLASASKEKPTSATTTLRLSQDGSKIDAWIQRVSVECADAKAKLAVKSTTEKVEFQSPLTALFCFAQSEKLKFEFPVPVSPSKYKVRIARKSSYIEIESPLFSPLEEDAASFMYPTIMTKIPSGATIPIPWTYSHINLDLMPRIDIKDYNTAEWLTEHAFQMFSLREHKIRNSKLGVQADTRSNIKGNLYWMFVSFIGKKGQMGKQEDILGFCEEAGRIDILFYPAFLRLDLINRAIVLDAVVIPLTEAMNKDPRMRQFTQELRGSRLLQITPAMTLAWKSMMPALVERCRGTNWKHASNCEYKQAGEVPLSKGIKEDFVSPLCSCGLGKFPSGNYLKNQMKKLPCLKYMANHYGTRVALAPFFPVPYVEV